MRKPLLQPPTYYGSELDEARRALDPVWAEATWGTDPPWGWTVATEISGGPAGDAAPTATAWRLLAGLLVINGLAFLAWIIKERGRCHVVGTPVVTPHPHGWTVGSARTRREGPTGA